MFQMRSYADHPEDTMSDDKINRGQPDRSKINLNEPYEVQYWTRHLGVTREALAKVIDKVGDSAAAVRKELTSAS
jgi:uncharacterized protein DUF3606